MTRTWPPTTRCGCRRRDARDVEALLTGQVAVAAYDDLGRLVDATGVQIPGVLDDLYAGADDRELGVTWHGGTPTLAVWAPTAQGRRPARPTRRRPRDDAQVAMRRDGDGVWSVRRRRSWNGATLPVRGRRVRAGRRARSRQRRHRPVLAGADDELGALGRRRPRRSGAAPAGWATLAKPALAQPEDSTIYELHVRDFSIGDETVPARTAARTWRSPTRPATACSTCARWPTPG